MELPLGLEQQELSGCSTGDGALLRRMARRFLHRGPQMPRGYCRFCQRGLAPDQVIGDDLGQNRMTSSAGHYGHLIVALFDRSNGRV